MISEKAFILRWKSMTYSMRTSSEVHTYSEGVIQNIERAMRIKYNKPNGNLKIVVEEKFQQDTRTIFRITISDTGIGMNEEL